MKIKPDYALKTVSGQSVVVSNNPDIRLNNNIVLNETAVFLWHEIENGVSSKEQLFHALLGEFDISTVLALSDIDTFLKTMRENGIIEL